MVYISLDEFNQLVSDGGYSGTLELSNATVLVALLFLSDAQNARHWQGSGYSLTQAEQDEIDNIVATAMGELMSD